MNTALSPLGLCNGHHLRLLMFWASVAFVPLAQGATGKPVPLSPQSVLASIKTPIDILGDRFAPRYRAKVVLGGDISAEIERSLSAMGINKPAFSETMDRRGVFELGFDDSSYTLETRNLLSGFLNPLEIIELTVVRLLKYREPSRLAALLEETNATLSTESRDGRAVYRIELIPRGKHFAYEHADYGTFMEERWLTAMSTVVDSAQGLVLEIVHERQSKTTSAAQSTPPRIDSATVRYQIVYGDSTESFAPRQLIVEHNGARALTISATYRKENKYVVFDSRSVCFVRDNGSPSCITMKFGTYTFGSQARRPQTRQQPSQQRSKSIEKAATLSRTASEHLHKGDISAAARVFERLARDFPTTPHGIEARNLLEAIPGGL